MVDRAAGLGEDASDPATSPRAELGRSAATQAHPSALFGRRVLVTNAESGAASLAKLLLARGAEAVEAPLISIGPPSDPVAVAQAVRDLASYDWLVFTSPNGVDWWMRAVHAAVSEDPLGKSDVLATLAHVQIAVIGPGTQSAVERAGLRATLVATTHKGEGLADELVGAISLGESSDSAAKRHTPRILIARAEVAREVLPSALRAKGWVVDVVAVYKNTRPAAEALEAVAHRLSSGDIGAVTFASASAVDHFADAFGERKTALLSAVCVASIGPVTTEAAARRGIRVDETADPHTLDGLVDAVERGLARRKTE